MVKDSYLDGCMPGALYIVGCHEVRICLKGDHAWALQCCNIAPSLTLIVLQDRRVVMKDAHQYIAALRARDNGPEAKVIVFPEDTHALDKPQTEYEQWVNTAWWVKRHI